MRFHVLALPHTVTDESYSACAFTQKVLKFCTMMHSRGHEVYHYGHERSNVDATEHISVMTDEVLKKAYGDYDWRSQQFKHDTSDLAHIYFNLRAAEEVSKRKRPGDFLLLFWGQGHSHVAKCHANDMIVVEPGIGSYNSLVAPYAVFESYSVMDHVYGKHSLAPRPLDSVIPNYFNVNDFIDISKGQIEESVETFVEAHAQKLVGDPTTGLTKLDNLMRLPQGQYVVVIARLIHSKGIQIAIDACREANIKLVIAGQGRIKDAVSATCQFEETDYDVPHGVTHVGYVEPLERAVLLARAKCLMAPTLYAEPFGGVNVEAQMCGLPVITTDWGAFAETVLHGYTGYRCRTLEQFLWALKNVDTLDKSVIRAWAVSNYGLTKIATMYEEYFGMLQRAQKNPKNGFYQENPGRLGLTWLQKSYPQS